MQRIILYSLLSKCIVVSKLLPYLYIQENIQEPILILT